MGSFSVEGMSDFLAGLTTGTTRTKPLAELPKIVSVEVSTRKEERRRVKHPRGWTVVEICIEDDFVSVRSAKIVRRLGVWEAIVPPSCSIGPLARQTFFGKGGLRFKKVEEIAGAWWRAPH